MSAEIQNRIAGVEEMLARIREASRFEEAEKRLEELEQEMADEGFWKQPQPSCQIVIDERKRIQPVVEDIRNLTTELSDVATLFELAKEEDDAPALEEVDEQVNALLKNAERIELRTLLSGDFDPGNAYLAINAGAGGTEACDWVLMLRRMFARWAERNGYKTEILEELPGEETGLKSCTFHITGPFAYGYLRSEVGVHRLVRVSPFDARGRRHTSFASVDVSPEVDDVVVEVDESDLRVDRYRSSGAGGQHVNVTDSAVRITHIPTGLVVQCQNQRSQHANRTQAMLVLKSRLKQLELQKRDEELAKITGEKGDIAFGSQIRSYVLHPYKMVKDHRTEVETGNVDQVLDGDLERFIEAYLRLSAKGGKSGD